MLPPPRGVVSESTDSRRKGGNAGRYVSSPGPEDKAESPDKEEPQASLSNVRHEDRLAEMRREVVHRAIGVMNTTPGAGGLSPHDLVFRRPDGGGTKEGSSLVEEGEKALLVSAIKEQALLATESGEHALLETENGEQAPNSTNARRRTTRPDPVTRARRRF